MTARAAPGTVPTTRRHVAAREEGGAIPGYTHIKLEEVEDSATKFGFGETQESHFANSDLQAERRRRVRVS